MSLNRIFCSILFYYGRFFTSINLWRIGFIFLDIILKFDDNYAEVWNVKGRFYKRKMNLSLSLNYFDRSLNIQPKNPTIWHEKGVVFEKMGRKEESIKCFENALKLYEAELEEDPYNHYNWSNKGIILQNLGKYEESLPNFDEALKLCPNCKNAWKNKGVSLVRLGRYKESLNYLDMALKLNPSSKESLMSKARSLQELKNYNLALACLDRVLDIKSDFLPANLYKIFILLCDIDEFEEALNLSNKILEKDPKNEMANNFKNLALKKLNNKDMDQKSDLQDNKKPWEKISINKIQPYPSQCNKVIILAYLSIFSFLSFEFMYTNNILDQSLPFIKLIVYGIIAFLFLKIVMANWSKTEKIEFVITFIPAYTILTGIIFVLNMFLVGIPLNEFYSFISFCLKDSQSLVSLILIYLNGLLLIINAGSVIYLAVTDHPKVTRHLLILISVFWISYLFVIPNLII